AIQKLWTLNDFWHGLAVAMALYGTVFGAALGGWPSDALGRKKTLFWIGILYLVSALGSALAQDVNTFMVFRFIGGLGVGASSVAAPLYISEISPAKSRGQLVAIFQFNIVLGILIAYVSNYALQGVGGEESWRWMLGIVALPSLAFIIFVLFVPESPRWLINKKNDLSGAKKVLEEIDAENAAAAINDIIESKKHEAAAGKATTFFNAKHNKIIWLAFLIAFFNQLSGINFILYYAPEILTKIGLGEKESLLNSIAIGGTNLIFTFVGLYLIDRLGRKTLMLIGSLGYIISLSMVAYAFKTGASPTFLMSFLLLFIASHAIGQGAVIWVFLSEIFPNKIRAMGQSFGASVHWVFAAIITLITPVFLDDKGGILKDAPWIIFAFLAGMMVLQLIWVVTKMPETKGVSLEELEKKLSAE
ncbi:MAG: sugar porter family MFS transporter, partial [Ferruginibacter sp.]